MLVNSYLFNKIQAVGLKMVLPHGNFETTVIIFFSKQNIDFTLNIRYFLKAKLCVRSNFERSL